MFKTVVLVWKGLNGTAPGYLSELCVSVASASGRHHLRSASTGLYYKFPEPKPRVGRRSFAIAGPSLEQSSCCCTETRDDSAHFQETTEVLYVPHMMCWRTEGTVITVRRCCDVFVILPPDTKLQTLLLMYTLYS